MQFSDRQALAISPGAKAILLHDLISAKIPVESGFVIASTVFESFVHHNAISEQLDKLLMTTSVSTPKDLHQVARQLRTSIVHGEFPEEAATQIISMYLTLGEPRVRLSPSFIVDDGDSSLFTEFETAFYGYQGDANLFEGIKEVWSHFFDQKPLFYRIKHGKNHFQIPFSICVQRQAQYKTTAFLYTDDPTSKTKQTFLTKVVFGEGALSGDIEGADYYWAKRGSGELYNSLFDSQIERIFFENGRSRAIPIALSVRGKRKLTNAQVAAVAKLAANLQQHFFTPQEALIGFDGERCVLIETKPFSHANVSIDPKISRGRQISLTSPAPSPAPSQPQSLSLIGLRHSLSGANHLPIAPKITGHLAIDPTPFIQDIEEKSTHRTQRLLAHELGHALDFITKHTHAHLGYIYEFSEIFDHPDQIHAQFEALTILHHTHSALPLTLATTAQTGATYQQAISLWIRNGFCRSSSVSHANILKTPAQLYRIDDYVTIGMDIAIFDLDILSQAIVGVSQENSHCTEDDAVIDLLTKSLHRCSELGIGAVIYCTTSPSHAMLNAIVSDLKPEWCTSAKTYTQMTSR